MFVSVALGGQERALDALGVELQTVGKKHHVGRCLGSNLRAASALSGCTDSLASE